MKDATFRGRIASAIAHLEVLERRGLHARANLHTWGGIGYPTSSNGARGGSGGHSDPTFVGATVALTLDERHDYARQAAELDECIETIVLAAARAAKLTVAATSVTERPGAEGCSGCAAVTLPTGHDCSKDCRKRDHRHVESWQPIHKRMQRPGDTGLASRKTPYCKWHSDFVENYGVEPASAIVLWHLDHLGSRVPYALIRDHHPVEFNRYQQQQRRGAA